MLTICRSASVASSLQEMPGATSSQPGSTHCGSGAASGGRPVSAAMRYARRVLRDPFGRSTSAGQAPNKATIGSKTSSSRSQSAQDAMCASIAGTSLEGSAHSA